MDLYMGKTLFISNIKYLGMVYWVKSDWFLGLITKGGHKSVKLFFLLNSNPSLYVYLRVEPISAAKLMPEPQLQTAKNMRSSGEKCVRLDRRGN